MDADRARAGARLVGAACVVGVHLAFAWMLRGGAPHGSADASMIAAVQLLAEQPPGERPAESPPVMVNPRDVGLAIDAASLLALPVTVEWAEVAAAADPGAPSGSGEGEGEGAGPRRRREAQVYSAPQLLAGTPPQYPVNEVRGRIEGSTGMEVCVSERGAVVDARLAASAGNARLDAAALLWVRRQRFQPARLDGAPSPACGVPVVYAWKIGAGPP